MKDQNQPITPSANPNLTVVGATSADTYHDHAGANSPLEKYTSATLDAQALYARAADEAGAGELVITAVWDHNTRSRNLTDAMKGWLLSEVMPLRTIALAWLNNQANDIKIDGRFDGLLLQSELDRIECKREQSVQDELERFNARNNRLLTDARAYDTRYKKMRGDLGGRDAQTPNSLLEFVIFLAILIPEAWLNFDSFRRAPMVQSDAMALGITIIIAAAIAIAAYLIGLFVRQLNYYLRPLAEGRRKSGLPLIGIGGILLIVSLAAVGYARYYYLIPIIDEARALGQPVPSLLISIGGLLLGNLLCFLIGAAITFLLHDPNPEFAEAARLSKKFAEKVEALRKPLQKRLEPIEARARIEREEAISKERQMHSRPGYQKLQEHFAKFAAKDAEVVGILNAYRGNLIRHEVKFTRRVLTADFSAPETRLSARQYAAEPIALHCA
jgi:hypothetical protein